MLIFTLYVLNTSFPNKFTHYLFVCISLEISAMQYDFHTLLKVSDICGLTGEIGFHDTDTGYLVSFPDDDGKADQRMAEYKKRLVDLENNIWNR